MSQRLILTALKSARLNGVPFRVRETEMERGDRERAEGAHGDGGGGREGGREKKTFLRREQSGAELREIS